MVTRPRMQRFWERWNYQPNDAEEFVKVRNRISHVVETKVWPQVRHNGDFFRELALVRGVVYDASDVGFGGFSLTAPAKIVNQSDDLFELAEAVQFILWAVFAVQPNLLDGIIESLNYAFALSPNVMLHIAKMTDGATVYPGGAGLLDDVLIEENLSWLEEHAGASKAFRGALAIYASKDADKYRNLLDNLRFAVEQLLKDALGNQRSLENQKDLLLPWLKNKGLHTQVTGMYHDLLFGRFATYQNDAVKHGEKYTPQEIEFMIYITGTFMRLLIEASKQTPSASQ